MLGHGSIVKKFHGVITPALGSRPEMGRVAEHLVQRYVGYNIFEIIPVAKLCNSASSRRKIADNSAEAVAGNVYINLHDWLKDDRVCLLYAIFQIQGSRQA